MLPEELRKRVRQIEFNTRKLVTEITSGQYRSSFRGHGVQFSEHRVYVPGDDVRHIDWKVSARTRDPLVKRYEEERELTVLLVVDVSGSEYFGSTDYLKSEMAAEMASLLAYAAIHTGDRVGVVLFTDRIEKIIPPKKGKSHILRIIRDILSFQPKGAGTRLGPALDAAGRILKQGGIVFVLSDFMDQDYGISLRRLARRHDVVAVRLEDQREHEPVGLGYLLMRDPETGRDQLVNSDSYAFKKALQEYRIKTQSELENAIRGGQVDQVRVRTHEDHGQAIVRFLRARSSQSNRRR